MHCSPPPGTQKEYSQRKSALKTKGLLGDERFVITALKRSASKGTAQLALLP